MHGVRPAAIVVKRVAVSIGHRRRDAASIASVARVAVGVCERDPGLRPRGVDGAPCGRVQRYLVGAGLVDAFDNVNFAGVGPVGAEEPKCWPNAVVFFSMTFETLKGQENTRRLSQACAQYQR